MIPWTRTDGRRCSHTHTQQTLLRMPAVTYIRLHLRCTSAQTSSMRPMFIGVKMAGSRGTTSRPAGSWTCLHRTEYSSTNASAIASISDCFTGHAGIVIPTLTCFHASFAVSPAASHWRSPQTTAFPGRLSESGSQTAPYEGTFSSFSSSPGADHPEPRMQI